MPGLSNIWVPPIRNRIDMLATGIKSPVGVKVAGADLADDRPRRRRRSSASVKSVPGVTSALAERLTGGRYIDVDIDRAAAARYGLNIADVQAVVSARDRRRERRRDVEGRAALPDQRALSARDARLARAAAQAADRHRARRADPAAATWRTIAIADGPPMLKSENARLSGWVYVDVRGRDLRSVVHDMQARGRRGGEAAAGLLGLVVGPVRVPGARDRSG